MSKVPVSVCMIAKNEEKYLEECLRRIKPYGFEIVITDTGSTDRTKEIAKKYADKVLDFEWVNDFSAARNFCVEHASNNWVLILDCDEYVENIDVRALRICMQKFPRCAGDMHMKIIAYDTAGRLQYTTANVTRFYNRNYYKYINPIHEQVRLIEDEESAGDIFHLPMDVVHQGYALSPEEMEKKQTRNIEMLQKALEEQPNDPYYLFQIGQSLIILNRYEEAVPNFEKAVQNMINWDTAYAPILVIALAKSYMKKGRFIDALNLMAEHEQQCHTAQYAYIQGAIHFDTNQLPRALFYFLKSVAMNDAKAMGENLADAYNYIIRIYEMLNNPQMAEPYKAKLEEVLKEREQVMATNNTLGIAE